MSTLWYEHNCGEVHAVEDDPNWFKVISGRTKSARVYNLRDQDYVNKIREFPVGYFDLISIDGSDRLACFEVAQEYLRPGGMLLVDNTDKDRPSKGDLYQIDRRLAENADYGVHRFTGWTHGNFFPQETTICIRKPSSDASEIGTTTK
jgi:predicted O-methyltransferase YrrM